MPLKVYKTLHIRPEEPGRKRLLLEGAGLYLYVWLDELLNIHSFQLVWNEALVLVFHRPSSLSTYKIGEFPIHRSLTQYSSADEMAMIMQCIPSLACDYLPEMVENVKQIASGHFQTHLELTLHEKEKIRKFSTS